MRILCMTIAMLLSTLCFGQKAKSLRCPTIKKDYGFMIAGWSYMELTAGVSMPAVIQNNAPVVDLSFKRALRPGPYLGIMQHSYIGYSNLEIQVGLDASTCQYGARYNRFNAVVDVKESVLNSLFVGRLLLGLGYSFNPRIKAGITPYVAYGRLLDRQISTSGESSTNTGFPLSSAETNTNFDKWYFGAAANVQVAISDKFNITLASHVDQSGSAPVMGIDNSGLNKITLIDPQMMYLTLALSYTFWEQ